MIWTDETRPVVEMYTRAYAWICMFGDNPVHADNFVKVNDRLMQLEDDLKVKEVTSDQISQIMDKVRTLLAKDLEALSKRELLFINQVIWGKDIKIENHYPRDTDMWVVDGKLMSYAFYKRLQKDVDKSKQK
jgi:hypothetical protein